MSHRQPPLPPLQFRSDGARFRALCRTADYEASLVHYPGGVIHPEHEHERAQLTFLLCGGFADDAEGLESEAIGSRHGFRPEGARHSCRFGPSGALILSVNFVRAPALPLLPTDWQPSGRGMAELFGLLLARAAPAHEVIDDALAAAMDRGGQGERKASAAPRWLRTAAEEMADDPLAEIASVAWRAGVHRVHLSRAFRKHFGCSPTQFRLHCKSARALRHMIEGGEPASAAAAAAGFADQAHWTRASRAVAGIAPGRIRALLAA